MPCKLIWYTRLHVRLSHEQPLGLEKKLKSYYHINNGANNETLARVRIMCVALCIIRNFLYASSVRLPSLRLVSFRRNVRMRSGLDLSSAKSILSDRHKSKQKISISMHWPAIHFTSCPTPTQLRSLFLDAWTSFRFDCMIRCWFISTTSTSHAHLTSLGFLLQIWFFSLMQVQVQSFSFLELGNSQIFRSFSLFLRFNVYANTPFIWFENALHLAGQHFVNKIFAILPLSFVPLLQCWFLKFRTVHMMNP